MGIVMVNRHAMTAAMMFIPGLRHGKHERQTGGRHQAERKSFHVLKLSCPDRRVNGLRALIDRSESRGRFSELEAGVPAH